jgi:hypothetical protein
MDMESSQQQPQLPQQHQQQQQQQRKSTTAEFLANIIGGIVAVKLGNGTEYRGTYLDFPSVCLSPPSNNTE